MWKGLCISDGVALFASCALLDDYVCPYHVPGYDRAPYGLAHFGGADERAALWRIL
ncbi:hypothetical protein DICSQDRAFT_141408, partial [Dichomitus squalens LYAD-421 SS1]